MTDKLKTRFAEMSAQLRANSETTAPEGTSALSRFRKNRGETKGESAPSVSEDLQNTAIYKVLVDTNLDPKEKAQAIAKLLTFNEEDLDANPKAIEENQAVLTHLMREFTEHNKRSIELTRDNPLSDLRIGIREVFEQYHDLTKGRGDLKDKLAIIDDIITKHGGPEGLIKALLSAKDKQIEKEGLDRAIAIEREKVEVLTRDVRALDTTALALRQEIAETESESFLWLKGEKRRKLAEDKQKRAEVEAQLEMKRQDMTVASALLSSKTDALRAFVTDADYQVHEQILQILDIGSTDFKAKLTDLSNITLGYIDNTTATLEGVSAQLKSLLGRVTDVHTLTQNTVENVAILLEGQDGAQSQNALKMRAIEKEKVEGGVAQMKRDKKLRALNQHTSSVEKTMQSTAAIAGEMGKVQIGLTNFKDQMQEGLTDAMEQQMLAVGMAAATGNSTLMRIETLATFVQGLVTKGQYKLEAQEHLGDLAKEMERSLMARYAKNEGIRSMADVLKEMTASMDDKNDVVLQIAEERKALIDRLIAQTKDLGRTNEDALAIEATVNSELYGSNDNDKRGERPTAAGAAPSIPALG